LQFEPSSHNSFIFNRLTPTRPQPLINAIRLQRAEDVRTAKEPGELRIDWTDVRRPDYEKARLAPQHPLWVSGFVLTNPEIEKVSGSVLADPEVSSDTRHTPVTGFIAPFAAAEEGWDREEVFDALNVALFVGGAITIPHVRRSYARNRGPQTFARLY
jgi:hypothetical protein